MISQFSLSLKCDGEGDSSLGMLLELIRGVSLLPTPLPGRPPSFQSRPLPPAAASEAKAARSSWLAAWTPIRRSASPASRHRARPPPVLGRRPGPGPCAPGGDRDAADPSLRGAPAFPTPGQAAQTLPTAGLPPSILRPGTAPLTSAPPPSSDCSPGLDPVHPLLRDTFREGTCRAYDGNPRPWSLAQAQSLETRGPAASLLFLQGPWARGLERVGQQALRSALSAPPSPNSGQKRPGPEGKICKLVGQGFRPSFPSCAFPDVVSRPPEPEPR